MLVQLRHNGRRSLLIFCARRRFTTFFADVLWRESINHHTKHNMTMNKLPGSTATFQSNLWKVSSTETWHCHAMRPAIIEELDMVTWSFKIYCSTDYSCCCRAWSPFWTASCISTWRCKGGVRFWLLSIVMCWYKRLLRDGGQARLGAHFDPSGKECESVVVFEWTAFPNAFKKGEQNCIILWKSHADMASRQQTCNGRRP